MEGEALKTKILFTVLAVFMMKAQAQNRVIYGDDNRVDVYQSSVQWQEKATSTVALMKQENLSDMGNGKLQVNGTTFATAYNLCESEPFREQSVAAFCSGSLIGPDLIMTAGHCVRTESACKRARFVFGWGYYSPKDDLSSVDALNVYSCEQLIVTNENGTTGADYALVKLDRPVIGYMPLKIRTEGVVSQKDPLVVIGHPTGLPTKVSGGANVRSVETGYFIANLDTYGGNSGSAVFNENTGVIEGILVRGVADFVYENGCRKSNVCTNDGCGGEHVTRMDAVIPYLPAQ